MNAPLPSSVLPPSVLKAMAEATLDDKYRLPHGRVFMSGVQALVRLPMLQHVRDAAAGLRTAGFVSGYRGSPLGGYDQALWQAKAHLQAHSVVFQPGVNEELAATAVWGSQQLDLYREQALVDGVFGLWYAKGPGVDRSCDVLKHANMAGTSRHGGVIAVAGDDHAAKSSSLPHQSDHIFKACGLPVFFPSSVQEILDLGLHAWAMSRFAGLWCAMKTIQEVVESACSVEVDPERVRIILPTDLELPVGGLHIRWPDTPLEQEARMMNHKWYAALAYIRANRLNHTVIDSPRARLGLIASGKAYNDLRQALHDLGLEPGVCERVGLRVHKVGVVWPLEASITREFAKGLQEILVVEEKRQVIEYQLKEEIYNWREDVRPNVLGKFDEPEGDLSGGEWAMANPSANTLLRAQADLNPALIARAVAQRLDKLGMMSALTRDERDHIAARLAEIAAKERSQAALVVNEQRPPWFCSGCPHNTSTKVPEGSRAMAGIGCHYMAMWMDRSTTTFTQMGGEGVPWVGLAPFTSEPHRFANLGDGTYFHSGLLAIRQSVAAGVNITYKILYNDAVAMTGGQPVEGHLSVGQMTHELQAEGVKRIVVVSDAPDKFNRTKALAEGVDVFHRDELDTVQRVLRDTPGCTVLIYEQTCATEKRRRRKRGQEPELKRHVMINEAVCEGCGDCGTQSNCLSVEPVETEFGTKRRINPNTCNQDFSCVKGFCPSFVTVEGERRAQAPTLQPARLASMPALPHPRLPSCEQAWGIVVAGVGGTGVITIGQVLGMAAFLDGKGVVTQDAAGLAQKGGATWSHVQIADSAQAIHTTRVATAHADVLLGCDAIVAAQATSMDVIHPGRTHLLLNTHATPTATVLGQRDWHYPGAQCEGALASAVGQPYFASLDATKLAEELLGDSLYANALMLGYAWQKGWIPLSQAALLKAMTLNGTQVERNHDAFTWGRHAAHDMVAVRRIALPGRPVVFVQRPSYNLDATLAQRQAYLKKYQNAAYAERYVSFVRRVQGVEQPLGSGEKLSVAVAQQLFRLMAYKDEYEVARLHTDAAWTAQLESAFAKGARLSYHFSPPWLSRAAPGHTPGKVQIGAWVRPLLHLMAAFRGLRGSWLDPFARSDERRAERAWIQRYRQAIDEVLSGLNRDNLNLALRIARVPQDIRGFGHIKQAAMATAERQLQALLAQWRGGPPAPTPAPPLPESVTMPAELQQQ